MSINLGFKNNSYSFDTIRDNKERDKLVLNTFGHSNAIVFNSDEEASSDVFINYRNKYLAGLKHNQYTVYDNANKNMIIEMSSNIVMHKDVMIKDLISTASNVTVINSNLSCFFKHSDDTLSIYDMDDDVLLKVDKDNTLIKSAVIENTLYVDRIQNFSGSSIEIVNPNIVGLVLQSFNIEEGISVKNVLTQTGTAPTILVNRYDNLANIIDIGTCNIHKPEIRRQFAVDRYGMVGIGPKQPEVPLHISTYTKNSPHIFRYDGENAGDTVNINRWGNIGIGTNNPKGLLHIHRNDDLKDDMIRIEPMLRLNMQYEIASNISYNSNVIGVLNTLNPAGVLSTNRNIQTSASVDTANYYNDFYIMNSEMQSKYNLLSYDTSNFNLRVVTNDIRYVNEITSKSYVYRTTNKIYYPSSLYAFEQTNGFSYSVRDEIVERIQHIEASSNTYNVRKTHTYTHNILMMSKETYEYSGYVDTAGPKYNANRFVNVPLSYSNMNGIFVSRPNSVTNTSSNYIHNIYFNINMLIENINHPVNYKIAIPSKVYDAPYFFYATSNNSFKASLSSYGTLSLGSPEVSNIYYQPSKYVLYADGLCYMNKVELNDIMTSNKNINFNGNNISNINIIHVQSNIVGYSLINNAYISNLTGINQFCSNIVTCNLIVENMNTPFMNMSKDNVHVNTYFSVAKSSINAQTTNNAMTTITVNRDLQSGNQYFKNYKGVVVTNETNVVGTALYNRCNPSISVIGYDNSIPYFNLNRNTTDYFMRINNKTFGTGASATVTDVFEICCDTITGSETRVSYYTNANYSTQRPSFINHIKGLNLMTFGEMYNICIDCTNKLTTQTTPDPNTAFTNSTNKISIGFPYEALDLNGYNIPDYPLYFKNVIMNNSEDNIHAPFMLNVFGYMGVFNTKGEMLMTLREKAINGVNTTILTVPGPIVCTKTETYAGTSDSNIKIDLKIIENALEKVNTLTGYTFYNTLSSNEHSGLIAQEVQQVLPEVVNRGVNEMLRIDYGNMMGLIVESIKDITKKLKDIDDRLKAIEERGT